MANIRKRGSVWQAQIRKPGQRQLTKTFKVKRDATVWARQVESDTDRGVFLDVTEAQQTTLSEALRRYESEILPSKKSIARESSRIKRLDRELGGYSLSRLSPSIISEYRNRWLKTHSPQTVKHEISLLSRVLNAAIKEWDIHLPHGNPVARVTMPKLPRGRNRRLNQGEEQLLLSALEASPMGRSLVLFALETAMRRGELAGMRWEDVNYHSQCLHIPLTKTDAPRDIPLSNRAVDVLRSLPRRIDGKVWGLALNSISQTFQRACRRAGIEDLRFHDLRHEATSRLFEDKGLSLIEVALITGHKDLRMLQRYTHLRAETLVAKLG